GWAASIQFNPKVGGALEPPRKRPDTFSLGVCNGCQLMPPLGWVGPPTGEAHLGTPGDPPREEGTLGPPPMVALEPPLSGRFESRFVTVRVEAGPPPLLRGMEGAVLGVWVAHGEP
ncbi:PUR4 synthase, partial [Menura novaehollandiae]|nr:PUR4 synthase [Menura novaehollandiae]